MEAFDFWEVFRFWGMRIMSLALFFGSIDYIIAMRAYRKERLIQLTALRDAFIALHAGSVAYGFWIQMSLGDSVPSTLVARSEIGWALIAAVTIYTSFYLRGKVNGKKKDK